MNTIPKAVYALLMLIVLFKSPAVFCQLREQSLINKDQVSIPSPNVSSLGLMREVPVSNFTGIPQIEIPLYTFTEGKISIPINLRYHASGFRPDMHPCWVGMGWSLDASAWVVSRKVNGKADDYDTYDNEQATGQLDPNDPYGSRSGYYYNRGLLSALQWNYTSYLNQLTGDDVNMRILGTRKDTEPDEFNFSFPNGSGRFYMNINGTWKVDCDRAVKVTFNNSFLAVPFNTVQGSTRQNFGYPKTFSGFTITDIDGTQYVYGTSTGFIEYSIDFVEQDTDIWQADSWYLKEIIEPGGKKISFEYERSYLINQLNMSLSQDFGTGGSASGFWQPPCGLTANSLRIDYTGRLISPVYLKRIVGTLGTLIFNKTLSSELKFGQDYTRNGPSVTERDIYSVIMSHFQFDKVRVYNKIFPIIRQAYYDNNLIFHNPPTDNYLSLDYAYFYACLLTWWRLDNIEIQNANRKIKTFNFAYGEAGKRLTLQSVTEGNELSTQYKPPYVFTYNTLDDVPYFSGKVDHWGFYNGQLNNLSELNTTPSLYYNSRAANSTYARQGVLNKVYYPTGAYSQFEYEGNYAAKAVPLDRSQNLLAVASDVGGLRIKKITNFNPSDTTQNGPRQYYYVKGYKNSATLSQLSSSGIVGGQIQYLFKDFKVPASGGAYFTKTQFNSLSQLPASNNSQGNHIGYSEVVEKLNDNTYTIYYYTNFDNGHPDEASPTTNLAFSPYGPYTSVENERGKLYKVEKYNAQDILIYKQETSYQAYDKLNQYAPAIRARSYTLCPQTNDRYSEAIAYKNYTYAYLPSNVTETKYDVNGSNAISTVTDYAYNDYRLVATESSSNSDLRTHAYKNYYPFDFPGTVPYDEMKQLNIIEPVIKQEYAIDNVIQDVYTTAYAKNLSSNSSLILPATITTQHVSNTPEVRIRFNKYDDRGNLLSYSKEHGITTCYVWAYAKNYPVAKIQNIDYSLIEAVIDSTEIEEFSNYIDLFGRFPRDLLSLNTFTDRIRADPRCQNAQVTSYTYDPLVGITTSKDYNKIMLYYSYDSFGRLKLMKDNDGNIVKAYTYHYAGQ